MTIKTSPTPGDDEQQPRRQTPTERYHELALLAANRAPLQAEHTIGLTWNAKGDVQIEVTGRGGDLTELELSVAATFDRLRQRYPRAEQAPAAGTPAKRS